MCPVRSSAIIRFAAAAAFFLMPAAGFAQSGSYNLFNRANFNTPGFTLGAAGFGVISSARPPRTMQLGARLSS